jgi:hypothetical protein
MGVDESATLADVFANDPLSSALANLFASWARATGCPANATWPAVLT